MNSRKKLAIILFIFLIALGLLVRLYKIDNTLTEWFSWRQTDTAAVGRFLIKDNFNLLKPRYYDLSNIQSGYHNPEGLRFVEFPLYNAAFALFYKLTSIFSIEIWARLVTIFFSLCIIGVIYYLLQREFGLSEAFFASLYFVLAPYVVFYSRAILPDMTATALTFIAIFFFYRYLRSNWLNLLLGTIFFALALLVKPTVIFYLLAALYLILQKQSVNFRKITDMGVILLISLLPVFLWRGYIKQFPEGVPYNQWLFTSVNTADGLKSIFFKPAFFRWIFFERINNLLLGGYLVFFALFGLFLKQKKHLNIHLVLIICTLLYLFTFQGGNVQHDYYQIIISPVVAILVGVGAGRFLKLKNTGYLLMKYLVVLAIFIFSFLFSFYQVRDNYIERDGQLLIADLIRSFTSTNDLIVTDTQGDTTLLYLSDRRGFPAPYRDFSELKKMGAKYFITSDLNYKETMDVQYKLIFENDKVLIFNL